MLAGQSMRRILYNIINSYIFPGIKKNGILAQVPSGSLPDLFQNMAWGAQSDEWDREADLWMAIRYARGSKLLRIPEEWRDVIPKYI